MSLRSLYFSAIGTGQLTGDGVLMKVNHRAVLIVPMSGDIGTSRTTCIMGSGECIVDYLRNGRLFKINLNSNIYIYIIYITEIIRQ